MNAVSQSESAGIPPTRGSLFVRILWFAIGYCALSSLTVPFVDRVWVAEVPVLYLIQLPKVATASAMCTSVVMNICSFSRGSFSADYSMARPYGLAIVYLVPMVIVGFIALRRSRFKVKKIGLLTLAFFFAAIMDYVLTLVVANFHHHSLKIY
jgi:hypothetical protein